MDTGTRPGVGCSRFGKKPVPQRSREEVSHVRTVQIVEARWLARRRNGGRVLAGVAVVEWSLAQWADAGGGWGIWLPQVVQVLPRLQRTSALRSVHLAVPGASCASRGGLWAQGAYQLDASAAAASGAPNRLRSEDGAGDAPCVRAAGGWSSATRRRS